MRTRSGAGTRPVLRARGQRGPNSWSQAGLGAAEPPPRPPPGPAAPRGHRGRSRGRGRRALPPQPGPTAPSRRSRPISPQRHRPSPRRGPALLRGSPGPSARTVPAARRGCGRHGGASPQSPPPPVPPGWPWEGRRSRRGPPVPAAAARSPPARRPHTDNMAEAQGSAAAAGTRARRAGTGIPAACWRTTYRGGEARMRGGAGAVPRGYGSCSPPWGGRRRWRRRWRRHGRDRGDSGPCACPHSVSPGRAPAWAARAAPSGEPWPARTACPHPAGPGRSPGRARRQPGTGTGTGTLHGAPEGPPARPLLRAVHGAAARWQLRPVP